MVRTIRLVLEYDGTDFAGWQLQTGPGARRTIQGELEAALRSMTGEEIRVRAASRTDAGVHARGQVVAFDTDKDSIPPLGFERGLTSKLPKSIVVRSAEIAEPGFVPRRRSRGKRYRYTYWNHRQPAAIDRRTVWFVRPPLDVAAMSEAARALIGTHDFSAFRAAGCSAKHAVRTLYEVDVRRGDYARIHLDVVGNAFVRNMVRIIAGTLRDVGLGRIQAADMPAIIASRERARAGMTAPARGLVLEEVIFDERLPPRPDQIAGEDDEEGETEVEDDGVAADPL